MKKKFLKTNLVRLNSLYIEDYKLLKKFRIDFKKPVSILIGINGSGKSSILESLAWIFRCAHLTFVEGKQENPPFEFELTYMVRIEDVMEETSTTSEFETNYIGIKLEGKRNREDYWSFETDNTKYNKEDLVKKYGHSKLLPTNTIIYYSGLFDTMHFICKEHEHIYGERLRAEKTGLTKDLEITSDEMYSRIGSLPMIYIQKEHFEILLASLFSYEFNDDLDKFFLEKIGVTKPVESTIVVAVKKRQWKGKARNDSFWGAEGLLLQFLELLRDNSVTDDGGYDEKKETYTFVFNIDKWYKIREFYGEEKKVFYLLHMLHVSEMLAGMKIYLSKKDTDISHNELSEGEQQLITIRGVNELLIEENSLLLFDEPDTYLHPSWQRTFISGIEKLKGNSQFVIATHSPQILSNFKNGEVHIVEKGKVVEITPKYYGKDINTILFEMMGVTERPKEIQDELRKLFRHIDDEDFESAKRQYNILKELLGKDDPELVRAQTLMKLLND